MFNMCLFKIVDFIYNQVIHVLSTSIPYCLLFDICSTPVNHRSYMYQASVSAYIDLSEAIIP